MDDQTDLTPTERAWLHFLRDISGNADPPPTFRLVQLLRRICEARR